MPRVVAWNQKEFEDFYVGFVYYYTPTLMRVGTVITGVLMAMAQVRVTTLGYCAFDRFTLFSCLVIYVSVHTGPSG